MTTDYSLQNPHPLYARLCAAGPIHRLPGADGEVVWLVARYAEARAALSDSRLPKQAPPVGSTTNPLVRADPAHHSELRTLMATALNPRLVEVLRPAIQRVADELLDAMASQGHADLVEEFALPLAVEVICELLAIPRADRDDFRARSRVLIGRTAASPAHRAEVQSQMLGYLGELVVTKRRDPGEDALSTLIASWDAGRELTDTELVWMAYSPLDAGYDTVAGLIANGLLALLRNPTQLALLRTDPSLIPGGVDELLRHDGPVEKPRLRQATEDIQIGSVTVRRGESVHVMMAAANRDPRRFADPDTLDVQRPASGHLGFGHGVHYCPGARLGRAEAEIAIGSLICRFDGLELAVAPENLKWHRTGPVRTVRHLPVRFAPEPTVAVLS